MNRLRPELKLIDLKNGPSLRGRVVYLHPDPPYPPPIRARQRIPDPRPTLRVQGLFRGKRAA